jgi:hypothetical protein
MEKEDPRSGRSLEEIVGRGELRPVGSLEVYGRPDVRFAGLRPGRRKRRSAVDRRRARFMKASSSLLRRETMQVWI